MTWPFKAVHTHVLPTGKVMFWDSFDLGDAAQIWDPTTNGVTPLPKSGVNIFCTGHSFLRDGRLLVTGGHIVNFVGLPDTLAFDPFDNTWSPLPPMNAGRWYPTNTTLPNGDVLVVSGQVDTTVGMNVLAQVFQVSSNTWRDLTTAQLALPFYPFMYAANGKVFMAGPDQTSRYLDPSGTGLWTTVADTQYGARNWGSSVMYAQNKIIIMGGTLCGPYAECRPTETAEIIDLNLANPSWTYTASMANARKHHTATLLPDGTVLVTGGSRGPEDPNATNVEPVNVAELWNPATNTWRTLAASAAFRGYHSTAVLLPDGRVLSAGGEITGPTAEIYSPPYLFNGARPTITAAPPYADFGSQFFVGTPDATEITRVTLIALSSVTHGFNSTQRIAPLTFTQGSGGLNVSAPANADAAPPGYYMLFLLNGSGVPSIARILRIDGIPTSTPAAPTALSATVTGTQVALAWTDNSGNETGFRVERASSADFAGVTSIGTVASNVTAYTDSGLGEGTFYYRVRAMSAAGDSGPSNAAAATVTTGVPATPADVVATATSSSRITVTWTDNADNETGFTIERSSNSTAGFTPVSTVGEDIELYSDTGLTASTTYYYRVQANSGAGNSAYSVVAGATTAPSTPTGPSAPTALTATATSAVAIRLNWTDNATGETGYKIERSPNGREETFAQITTAGANTTTYQDSGLLSGVTYYYRVRATDAGGDSGYSNIAWASTTFTPGVQAPAAPTNLLAVVGPKKKEADLTWTDNSSDETEFTLERSLDSVKFQKIAVLGPNVTKYRDDGLKSKTKYFYRVRASNKRGDSPYSNIAMVATPQNNGKNASQEVASYE